MTQRPCKGARLYSLKRDYDLSVPEYEMYTKKIL